MKHKKINQAKSRGESQNKKFNVKANQRNTYKNERFKQMSKSNRIETYSNSPKFNKESFKRKVRKYRPNNQNTLISNNKDHFNKNSNRLIFSPRVNNNNENHFRHAEFKNFNKKITNTFQNNDNNGKGFNYNSNENKNQRNIDSKENKPYNSFNFHEFELKATYSNKIPNENLSLLKCNKNKRDNEFQQDNRNNNSHNNYDNFNKNEEFIYLSKKQIKESSRNQNNRNNQNNDNSNNFNNNYGTKAKQHASIKISSNEPNYPINGNNIFKDQTPSTRQDQNQYESKIHPHDALFSLLTQELHITLESIKPTSLQAHFRNKAITKLKSTLENLLPNSSVQLYGSSITNLSLNSSDIDLTVIKEPSKSIYKRNQDQEDKETFNRVLSLLIREHLVAVGSLRVLRHCRVPLIKFTESQSKIDVDITVNQSDGVASVAFVCVLVKKFPILKSVVLIVKLLLRQYGLNDASEGGMSSYLVFHLVLAYFYYEILQVKELCDNNWFEEENYSIEEHVNFRGKDSENKHSDKKNIYKNRNKMILNKNNDSDVIRFDDSYKKNIGNIERLLSHIPSYIKEIIGVANPVLSYNDKKEKIINENTSSKSNHCGDNSLGEFIIGFLQFYGIVFDNVNYCINTSNIFNLNFVSYINNTTIFHSNPVDNKNCEDFNQKISDLRLKEELYQNDSDTYELDSTPTSSSSQHVKSLSDKVNFASEENDSKIKDCNLIDNKEENVEIDIQQNGLMTNLQPKLLNKIDNIFTKDEDINLQELSKNKENQELSGILTGNISNFFDKINETKISNTKEAMANSNNSPNYNSSYNDLLKNFKENFSKKFSIFRLNNNTLIESKLRLAHKFNNNKIDGLSITNLSDQTLDIGSSARKYPEIKKLFHFLLMKIKTNFAAYSNSNNDSSRDIDNGVRMNTKDGRNNPVGNTNNNKKFKFNLLRNVVRKDENFNNSTFCSF